MSNYAQIITSFERTSNFPIESNYIFASEEKLKEFYSNPIQAATLHKGLLKVVEADENAEQALYWVTKKEGSEELEFTKLISGKSIEEIKSKLADLLAKLEQEIRERKEADSALWGTDDPSTINEQYNSIKELAEHLQKAEQDITSLNEKCLTDEKSLKNQIKALAGTTEEDVIAYLDTLPYHNVTELAKAVNRIINDPDDAEKTKEIDTLKELKEFLKGYTNEDTLDDLLDNLWQLIEGNILPSEQFRTLRGVEDFIINYKTTNDYKQSLLLEEVNNIETGVGLNANGSYSPDMSTNYLKDTTSVMNALQTLDKVLYKYVSTNVPSVRNTDPAVNLSLTQELNSYVLSAALNLSTQGGNQLLKNTDGLYSCAKTFYDKGVLTFKVNDNIVSQHYIGMSAIVQSATYDKTNEQLVFVFKLANGDTQTVQVPVGALIREWEIDNKDTSPIVLNRQDSVAGTDALSADIRLSTLPFNILIKDHNTLYVKGTSDNLYHEGAKLSGYLNAVEETIQENLKTNIAQLEKARLSRESIKTALDKEITDRTQGDSKLQKDIDTLNGTLVESNKTLTKLSEKNVALDLELKNEILRSTKTDEDLLQKIKTIKHPEYSVFKQTTPEAGCIATYVLKKDGLEIGDKINVLKDTTEVKATFNKGILSLLVNNEIVNTLDIGLSSSVKTSYYDPTTEELVIEYNLLNGQTQVVKTSLKTLIKSIETNLEGTLEEFSKDLDTKAPIDSPVFKGVPQSELSPEDNDSSQRIATTAWVQEHLEKTRMYARSLNSIEWIDINS